MRSSVDVHNFLLERDVPHELVPMRGRVRSPDRIASVLGLEPEQVGRVVVLGGERALVAVVVPSRRKPDPRRVAAAARSGNLRELSSDEVAAATDYLAETVPPVALPNGTRVVVERSLLDQEVLYFPGGETTTLLKIRAEDLVRAAGAKVARVLS